MLCTTVELSGERPRQMRSRNPATHSGDDIRLDPLWPSWGGMVEWFEVPSTDDRYREPIKEVM